MGRGVAARFLLKRLKYTFLLAKRPLLFEAILINISMSLVIKALMGLDMIITLDIMSNTDF